MEDRILRKPEVLARMGLSDPSIWRREKVGKFPQRIQLGGTAIGWRESEITEWIENCTRGPAHRKPPERKKVADPTAAQECGK